MEEDLNMEFQELNEDIRKFCSEATIIALDSIEANGSFNPFVVLKYGDQKKLERFVADDQEEAIEAAEEFLEELDELPEAAVIVYQDSVSVKEDNHEAIRLLVHIDDEDNGYAFVRLFRNNDGMEVSDEFISMGNIRNVLMF